MSQEYDVIVIGGGGAGLTAALYTARADLKTVLFEKSAPGGQIAITDMVENFPGFPEGVTGPDIAMRIEEQARKNGADVRYEEVTELSVNGDRFQARLGEEVIYGKGVILATGAKPRMLNVPREKEFIGKGISYCATCDAPFFRNKTVAVIGGGDAALQEALFLTKFVAKLYIVHRRDKLRAGIVLEERARQNEKIEFVWNSVVADVKGTSRLEKIILKDVKTQALRELAVDGVFVFIGHTPVSRLVTGLVDCDESGYVKTDERFQTTVPGLFACGEVRHGATWQLVAACGEGCQAAINLEKYLEEIQ